MSECYGFQKADEISGVDINVEIVRIIAQMENLSSEEAAFLYKAIFFTAHGIASLVATNHCDFTAEEIRAMLEHVFYGTSMKIKSERQK